MIKFGLWAGTSSLITYLASAYSDVMQNILLIFVLSMAALLLAILPQIIDGNIDANR